MQVKSFAKIFIVGRNQTRPRKAKNSVQERINCARDVLGRAKRAKQGRGVAENRMRLRCARDDSHLGEHSLGEGKEDIDFCFSDGFPSLGRFMDEAFPPPSRRFCLCPRPCDGGIFVVGGTQAGLLR